MSVAILIEIDETQAALELTIVQGGVGGVTGQSPTVRIKKHKTSEHLDFGDDTFKASPGTIDLAMSDDGRGHYSATFNVNAITNVATGDFLIAEFHVDDGAGVVGDAHDVYLVVEEIAQIPTTAPKLTAEFLNP